MKHVCERFAPSEASCHGQIGTALDNGILGRGQADISQGSKSSEQ